MGTVFKLTDSTLTTLISFDGSNGSHPYAGLVQTSDGAFFGTTRDGGALSLGTIFQVSTGEVFAVLASLRGSSNGNNPYATMTESSQGEIYGTTLGGGVYGGGTVFKITPGGALSTLVTFDGTNGSSLYGALLQLLNGSFCGTTYSGGTNDLGTVFRMTVDGTLDSLASFAGVANGSGPFAGLVQGLDGNFYGTTTSGGISQQGTIFRFTSAGVLTRLVSFNGSNGSTPHSKLVLKSDGSFFGTTLGGGSYGNVFSVTTNGFLTTINTFNMNNGGDPQSGLVRGKDGKYYGTTPAGGFSPAQGEYGTIYRVTESGTFTSLIQFRGLTDARTPYAELLQHTDGSLYGTTVNGGVHGKGTVFKVETNGTWSIVFSFRTNGSYPYAGLVEAADGSLYGTTRYGGSRGGGTIFRIPNRVAIQRVDADTVISFKGVPGKSYGVQATTNLINPTWELLATRIAPSNAFFQVVDTNTSLSARFYRVTW